MLDEQQNDGTLDTAAQAIAAARETTPQTEVSEPESQERSTPQSHGTDGRFQKTEAQKSEAEPAETGKESAEAEAAAEDDEDYLEIEMPGEEGKEPTRERMRVSEVWQGFQRAKELEAELEQAKSAKPLPTEYETALEETIGERMRYVEALQSWSQYNQPRAPSRDLINPASQNYNPDLYYQQMQAFDETQASQARVAQEIERVQKLNEEQHSKLLSSKLTRERAKLAEVWPELVKDRAVAEKFVTDLATLYGVDGETLRSVNDHRFYALAKDALAYRAAETAKKEAARVVIGKPKLVRANARTTTNSKTAAFQGAMDKLSSSHSLDDAAAAIAALR